MKKIIIFILLTIASVTIYSQITSAGMQSEFKEIAGLGSRQSGFEGFQTYKSNTVNGSQFFYENWCTGAVTTIEQNVISSNNYLYTFDKVRQELFIKLKDSSLILLADKNQIFSFTLKTDRTHLFEQASKYDTAKKGIFFEVLVKGKEYDLLKYTKTIFEKANLNDIEKIKQGEFNDEFVDKNMYYVYQNDKLTTIDFKQRTLLKALKPKASLVNSFFSLHENDEMNEQLLIDLFNSLN